VLFRSVHEVYQVLGAKKGIAYRYASRLSRKKDVLFGRDKELQILEDNVTASKSGSGVATTIIGEAGIGKSEFLNQLLDSPSAQGCLLLKLQCSPEHTNSGFFPFINYVRWVAGVGAEALPQEIHDGMLRFFKNVWRTDESETDLMLDLFSPIGSDKGASGAISPPLYRRMMFSCLCDISFRFADTLSAMLFVVEDVQWIDPASAEMLRRLQELGVGKKVAIILTSRPDRASIPVLTEPLLTINLHPLNSVDSQKLARQIWPEHELSAERLDAILSKAEGNPLFIAEYVEAVREAIESGKVVELDSVPVTINGIIQGKLDKLKIDTRRFVQAASVFGRMFDPAMVGLVVAFDEKTAKRAMHQLTVEGFVKKSEGLGPNRQYMFRHATVRDGIYASLSKGPRKKLHSSIATRMLLVGVDGNFGSEIIAEHLLKAGRWEDASRRYFIAAKAAHQRRSPDDARRFVLNALEVSNNLSAGELRDKLELKIRRLQSVVLIQNGGPAEPQFGKAVQRILALTEKSGNGTISIPTLYLNGLHCWSRGDMKKASEIADKMEAQITPSDGDGAYVSLSVLRGQIAWHLGENDHAIQMMTLAINRFDSSKHAKVVDEFALDFGVYSRLFLSFAELTAGNVEKSLMWIVEVERISKQTGHAHSVCFRSLAQIFHAMAQGDDVAADKYSSEALAYAVRHGFPEFSSKALFCRGWLACRRKDFDHGLQMMRRGLVLWKAVGFRIWQPYMAAMLIDMLIEKGDMNDAEDLLKEYNEVLDQTQENQAKVPMLLSQVKFLQAQGNREQASSVLQEAEKTAQEQGAKFWFKQIDALRS